MAPLSVSQSHPYIGGNVDVTLVLNYTKLEGSTISPVFPVPNDNKLNQLINK